jgi:hypothetical protein
MNQTTHNLLAHVLPAQPLRQWVLSYGRRLAPDNGTAQGGLLTVIQRSSGDMRLNPHLHVVALDGLYVTG